MCCGSKRMQWKNSETHARSYARPIGRSDVALATAPQAVPQSMTDHGHSADQPLSAGGTPPVYDSDGVGITYLESSPIRVRGLASGRSYEFSAAARVQQVDARDASSLLRTRFFRPA